MRRFYLRILVLGTLLFPATAQLFSAPFVLRGRVVAVQDGDSLTILDSAHVQYKIRLAGIDAPEKKQPFGGASKRSLSSLAYDRNVEVHVTKSDRYGRFVAKVLVDGRDASLEQLKRGMAWFYFDYERELSPADRESYLAAHRAALASRIGLWTDAAPMPPWQFRRLQRQ